MLHIRKPSEYYKNEGSPTIREVDCLYLIRFWYWNENFLTLQAVIDDRYFEEWCWGALSEHCYFDPNQFTLDIKPYYTYYDVYLVRGHWYYESLTNRCN